MLVHFCGGTKKGKERGERRQGGRGEGRDKQGEREGRGGRAREEERERVPSLSTTKLAVVLV